MSTGTAELKILYHLQLLRGLRCKFSKECGPGGLRHPPSLLPSLLLSGGNRPGMMPLPEFTPYTANPEQTTGLAVRLEEGGSGIYLLGSRVSLVLIR